MFWKQPKEPNYLKTTFISFFKKLQSTSTKKVHYLSVLGY